MDPTLHQKQGVNHLNKVLGYAPFVAEGDAATVHLTQEDWYVVADTLFRMNTPKEMLPGAIDRYELANENRTIRLHTAELTIDVEAM
jgi:hypothetical protein